MAQLKEGEVAPAFALPTDVGGTFSSATLKGKKAVLYFYPKADTPGCTKEAQEFNDLLDDFGKLDCVVLAISPDPMNALARFKAKHGLAFPLLGDERHEMLAAYGVWTEKSMYGRRFMGVERSTFLIGRDGRLARIWRKVKVDGHAREVLAAARSG